MDWLGPLLDSNAVHRLWPYFVASWLIALPIWLYRNLRFTGMRPKSQREWKTAIVRMIAVGGALFCVIGAVGGSDPAAGIGFGLALCLCLYGCFGSGSDEQFALFVGCVSILFPLLCPSVS